MKINCCGRNCEDCDTYQKNCMGCYNYRDKKPVEFEEDMCPIYKCAMTKFEIRNCSQCPDLPCDLFDVCVNKSLNKIDWENDKIRRVEILKGL